MRFAFLILAVPLCLSALAGQARAAELVFFMSEACGICERWNDEIGGIYPKTDEAKVLPLRVQSVHDDMPADLAFVKGVAFTPTFVVVDDGKEVGRIVGYISDYFFWEQIGGLIKQTAANPAANAAACVGNDGNGAKPASC